MKTLRWVAIALAGFSALSLALAEPPQGKTPSYDPKSEVVVRGKVAAVVAIPDWMGKNGVNVTLQTPDAVQVHVDTAPEEFLKMLDFSMANGDDLEVTGVWSRWDGQHVLLARTVTQRKVTIAVRDPDGKPIW